MDENRVKDAINNGIMNNEWKGSSKSGLIGISIGAIITIPYFIWHSFWCLCVGLIIAINSFAYLIYSFFKKDDGESFFGIGTLLITAVSILCFFWHDNRYITWLGNKQHLYEDCNSLSRSKDIKMVTEAEGFFYLKFSDCKICKNRQKELRAQEKADRKERERNNLRPYLQDLIDRLDEGEDPDDIEDKLIKDWTREDDDDDYIRGVPSRYQ